MRIVIVAVSMFAVALFTALAIRLMCWVCGVQVEEMGRELMLLTSLMVGFMGGGVGGSAIADEMANG